MNWDNVFQCHFRYVIARNNIRRAKKKPRRSWSGLRRGELGLRGLGLGLVELLAQVFGFGALGGELGAQIFGLGALGGELGAQIFGLGREETDVGLLVRGLGAGCVALGRERRYFAFGLLGGEIQF